MSRLTSEQFGEYLYALHGHRPFPWQDRLARRVAEAQRGDDPWPRVLALPTAAGKTACIDIGIYALACQADRSPGERSAPRRICFVVDRRVIVDETFARATRLAQNLHEAKDGILKDVADRLRSLSGEDEPLASYQLRGGMYRDDAWARSPLQPTVIVTTVDQFASRLLFRGYGSSAGMRPVHAGLAANDSLVLLDEAHCARPFSQTVEAVRRFRQWAYDPASIGSVRFQLTLISATPPLNIGDEDRFIASDEDWHHEVLGKRIRASKPAKLVVANARGDDPLERLAQQVADEAVSLENEERKAIGIMVNRVATARLVHRKLAQYDRDVTLLTGRMRPIDRDDVDLAELKTGAQRNLDHARFIVATQCLEVGADLDFDGLVTECASLDALRQRFGRLNRDGRPIEARATIVIRSDQTNPSGMKGDDPIYGTALAATWQWLKSNSRKDEIDLGYASLDRILPSDVAELDKLTAPTADAPVMLPAHVDARAQTSPVPSPEPDVSLFLHGPNRGAPEVQVCWRADLSQSDMSGERPADIVSLCPPVSSECISTPIYVLSRWLEGTGSGADPDDNDLEGVLAPPQRFPRESRQIRRRVLCWRGPEESYLIATPEALNRLSPGDTVVIPAEMGGWEVFGHIPPGPDGKLSIDLGDRAHLQSRAKPLLRIHHQLLEDWPETPVRDFFQKLAQTPESSDDWDGLESSMPTFLERLATEIQGMPRWQWLKDAAHALAVEYGNRRTPKITTYPGAQDSGNDKPGFVLQGSRRVVKYTASSSTLTSEDDSYSATVRVTLEHHLCGVEEHARRFGTESGLPESLVGDLALAARLHDVGKADPRFQSLLHGGNPWAAQASGTLLAKSGTLPTSREASQRAHRESGYPTGGRHELLSVRLIEGVPGLLESANDRDLVLHLIASHHGFCRPFAPVVRDDSPVRVEDTVLGYPMSANSATGLERLDSGVPERFWRLVRRYGWWGLAWLEALMRLADHRRSEAEQRAHEE